MIDSDWLVQSARQTNPEPGRPKQMMLRRSISNLYYALFHELCRQTAKLHVGASPSAQKTERYVLVYRSLEHARTKSVFQSLAKNPNISSTAARLARLFILLQDARHRADYDPHVAYTRAAVRALALDAEWALAAARGRFADKDLLLTKLIVKERT